MSYERWLATFFRETPMPESLEQALRCAWESGAEAMRQRCALAPGPQSRLALLELVQVLAEVADQLDSSSGERRGRPVTGRVLREVVVRMRAMLEMPIEGARNGQGHTS